MCFCGCIHDIGDDMFADVARFGYFWFAVLRIAYGTPHGAKSANTTALFLRKAFTTFSSDKLKIRNFQIRIRRIIAVDVYP